MSKSSRVAAAAAKIRDVRSDNHETVPVTTKGSFLPPLPSEVVAAEEAKTGVVLTDEERLAALTEAAAAPPTIPVVEVAAPVVVPAEVRGRRVRYATTDHIVVRKTNPKRPGTAGYDRYAVYQTGMTAAEYMINKKVGKFARADLAWDIDRGFIELVPRAEFAAAVATGEVIGKEHAEALIASWSEKAEEEATSAIAEAAEKPDEG